MPAPSIIVQIAFDYGPLDDIDYFVTEGEDNLVCENQDELQCEDLSWVNVTNDVRNNYGIIIYRGRPTESDQFNAGLLSFELDNRDRHYDPLNSSSPYNGKLTPRRQIRVQANTGTAFYPMFRGHVTGFPTTYPLIGQDATVQVTAYDALALLNNIELPDQMEAFVNTLSVWAWFRKVENGVWVDIENGLQLLPTGPVTIETQSIAANLTGSTAIDFNSDTYWSITKTDIAPAATKRTVSFWIETTDQGTATEYRIVADMEPFIVYLDEDGQIHFNQIAVGTIISLGSQVPINDGKPHHICITDNPSASETSMYVDGVLRQTDTGNFTPTIWTFGTRDHAYNYPGFVGTLQDVLLLSQGLTAAQVIELYSTGIGLLPETATQRVNRILDAVSWPTTARALTTVPETIVTIWEANDTTALQQLTAVADTENSRLFIDTEGNVRFHDRGHDSTTTVGNTVQAIFSDDGTHIDYEKFNGFDPGDRDIINDAIATGYETEQRSTDATSIASYGRRTVRRSTLLDSASELKSLTDGLIYLRKDPKPRAQPITVSLHNTSDWATLLGLDIGHRYQIELTPLNVGSTITKELIIDSLDWTLDTAEWSVTIAGRPVDPDWFVVGSSTVGSTDVVSY